jgi:nucleoside-diphosphate-sugar epimerase
MSCSHFAPPPPDPAGRSPLQGIFGRLYAPLQRWRTCSPIRYQPMPRDDPMQRKPDITLAREKLGWEPRVTLRQGLLRTIEYYESVLTRG